jgi:hypothetical protein
MPAFKHCGWCNGRGNGCICCEAEEAKWLKARNEEYDRQFPNGPVPMFTAKLDSPSDMAALAHAFHRNVLVKAFGPGGGGVDEIEQRAAEARAMQQEAMEIDGQQ